MNNTQSPSAKKSMFTRIWVGVLLACLFFAVLFFGGVIQHIICSLIAMLCVYEVNNVFRANGFRAVTLPAYIFAAAICPIYILSNKSVLWLGLFAFLTIMAQVFWRLIDKNVRNEDMFISLSLYAYPLLPITFLIFICNISDYGISRLCTLMLFASPLLCDTFAYFFGIFFGKAKLCPSVSPKKTIVGAIGGLLGGIAGGALVYFAQPLLPVIFAAKATSIGLLPLLLVGISGAVVGQTGDLFASCIKRWAGVKDFGTLFPGHGGVMDRLDSVLMCAPMMYMVFELFLI